MPARPAAPRTAGDLRHLDLDLVLRLLVVEEARHRALLVARARRVQHEPHRPAQAPRPDGGDGQRDGRSRGLLLLRLRAVRGCRRARLGREAVGGFGCGGRWCWWWGVGLRCVARQAGGGGFLVEGDAHVDVGVERVVGADEAGGAVVRVEVEEVEHRFCGR